AGLYLRPAQFTERLDILAVRWLYHFAQMQARLCGLLIPERRRPMVTDERASVCTFDCPDACSLRVSVADDRIVKVRGSDAAPYTAGVICNKVAREMTEFVHGP